MSQPNSIHIGHGQMVDIVTIGTDAWELVFSEAGVADYKAPPLAEVEVDAIDGSGRIHPLAISSGSSGSRVRASGHVAGAYRARVRVVHGDHFHTRESPLPGASAVAPARGPSGGALATFDDGLGIEVSWVDSTRWQLTFLRDGKPVSAPASTSVIAQAVGPRAEDYQIRNLATEPSPTGETLIVGGKIKDATFARLTLKTATGEQIRSIPIIPA
ncbi:hypothetical protein [Bosea sp. PAMC 26642]|uniref:hypothetical protein n=1 Tax=Bosea sp. (strain PAMC 26642) TaxID=1792307 RepID=UPI0007703B04|nr:hypothetical protein [Bosea sp. PAMC 26642]AMJ61704.1 hypothetical protein AXW83_16575 [Bosea sp. PAMC 26642]